MSWMRGCFFALGCLFIVIGAGLWIFLFKGSGASFDAAELAASETRMWKAYYAKDPVELHSELNFMLHSQFGLSRYRTWQVSSILSMASMEFARSGGPGSATTQEKLIQELTRAYEGIREGTGLTFDPRKAAEAELAWWVARRTPGKNSVEEVGAEIEALYAILYGKTNDHMAKAGLLRAQAARVRDQSSNWSEVEGLLVESYRELLAGIGQ